MMRRTMEEFISDDGSVLEETEESGAKLSLEVLWYQFD